MSRAALKDRVVARKFGRRGAFVKQGIKRLFLFGGDATDPDTIWIDVKERLSYGERQEVAGSMLESLLIPQSNDKDLDPAARREQLKRAMEIRLDVAGEGPTSLMAWLVEWNLEDEDGTPVALCLEALLQLDPEVADEIGRVIEEHASGN